MVFFSPGTNFWPFFPVGGGSHRVCDTGVYFRSNLGSGTELPRPPDSWGKNFWILEGKSEEGRGKVPFRYGAANS